jgi:hypothetical protein
VLTTKTHGIGKTTLIPNGLKVKVVFQTSKFNNLRKTITKYYLDEYFGIDV